jgi:hypothetical protein
MEKNSVRARVRGPFNEIFLCGSCEDLALNPSECPNCGLLLCESCLRGPCSCG